MNKELEDGITKEIGAMIRQARKERGLTQRELGELLGVNSSTVNRYEVGGQNMTIDTLHRIASALHVAMKYFFENV